MPNASKDEKLSAIGSLLSRTSAHRNFSARVALTAGILALLVSIALYAASQVHGFVAYASSRNFVYVWIALLIVVLIVAAIFRRTEIRREHRVYWSLELATIVRQAAPFCLIPAATTVWFLNQGFLGNNELLLVTCWIASYGLILLSLSFFLPSALTLLGWIFLFTGLLVPTLLLFLEDLPSYFVPTLLMGATFGGYHIVYALGVWMTHDAPKS